MRDENILLYHNQNDALGNNNHWIHSFVYIGTYNIHNNNNNNKYVYIGDRLYTAYMYTSSLYAILNLQTKSDESLDVKLIIPS